MASPPDRRTDEGVDGRIEEIEEPWRFAALREEWAELSARSDAPIFLRWEWLFPWWSRLGRGATPLLVAVRSPKGALEGLLPLRRSLGGLVPGLRRWSFLGEGFVGSDGLAPLVARDGGAAAMRLLAAWVARESGRWDLLRLADLPSEHPWLSLLEAALAQRGIAARRTVCQRCPGIDLGASAGFAAYLQARPRRENFLRRRRWLERQPTYLVTRARTPVEVSLALGHFLRLHERRWGRRWSDAVAGAPVEGFHREAAPLLAQRGLCEIHLAWLHGRPVAGVYALTVGSTFYYYLPAYDPGFCHRSVGTVLLGQLVELAFAEGYRRFEFLRGEEAYKADWATDRWECAALTAVSPRWAARLADGAEGLLDVARGAVSSAVPEALTLAWRNALASHNLRAARA